jgi:hypothetical protein
MSHGSLPRARLRRRSAFSTHSHNLTRVLSGHCTRVLSGHCLSVQYGSRECEEWTGVVWEFVAKLAYPALVTQQATIGVAPLVFWQYQDRDASFQKKPYCAHMTSNLASVM